MTYDDTPGEQRARFSHINLGTATPVGLAASAGGQTELKNLSVLALFRLINREADTK